MGKGVQGESAKVGKGVWGGNARVWNGVQEGVLEWDRSDRVGQECKEC